MFPQYTHQFRILELGMSKSSEYVLHLQELQNHFKEYFRPSLSEKLFNLMDKLDGADGVVTIVAVHSFLSKRTRRPVDNGSKQMVSLVNTLIL